MKIILLVLMLCSCGPVPGIPLATGARPSPGIAIATGTLEGTYHNIARDIQRVAEKDGIAVELVQTNGSFDNINLLGSGKVDLAILQLDVLKFTSEVMHTEAGVNVLDELKVVLNLYFEEIHVIARTAGIRSLEQLAGKRVAVGPERSGSALTAEVLLAAHSLQVQKFFDPPSEALRKLESGDLDALIFVGGAPVPGFEKLDKSFHFIELPASAVLEQIYRKKKIDKTVYPWAGEIEAYSVPSVLMTRARNDFHYIVAVQKLVLSVLVNKDLLDSTGHAKWRSSFLRSIPPYAGYAPATDVIQILNTLESYGYGVLKK